MVSAFAHLSYRQQQNQELLRRLSSGILALKLEAQGRLDADTPGMLDAHTKRRDVADFLADLMSQAGLLAGESGAGGVDLAYSDLADRLVRDAQGGVADRLDQFDRLRRRLLTENDPLTDRDYRLLDRLQTLLEEETADDVRGLFRF